MSITLEHPHIEDSGIGFDEIDGDDHDGEGGVGVERSVPDPGASGRAGQVAAGRKGAEKALIRRVAGKAVELAGADPAVTRVLAHLLGVSDDVVDLTTAVMTAGRAPLVPLADLNSIVGCDPLVAGVTAAALPRERLRPLWALLVEVGALKGQIPGNDTKAAIAIAQAALTLPEDTRASLLRVADLAKRG